MEGFNITDGQSENKKRVKAEGRSSNIVDTEEQLIKAIKRSQLYVRSYQNQNSFESDMFPFPFSSNEPMHRLTWKKLCTLN